ncbi:MAG: HAD-IC family P-type ATPase [Patescibacteria group bacterium]|jgi:Ca2+-transporting ATPase
MKYRGLTSNEAKKNKGRFGANVLPEEKFASGLSMFLSQFANPLVYVLLAIGVVSLIAQKPSDAIFIFLVVFLNSIFGFTQEYKTQRTLIALKRIVKPKARVIRDGLRQEIEAIDLVPGDVVLLGIGDRVPADGAILEASSFFADEAILTGESESMEKKKDDLVFMGTIVAWGTAVIQIKKTGAGTKIGEIAKIIKETIPLPTILQVRLKKLVRGIIFIGFFLCTLALIVGLYVGYDFWEIFEIIAVLLAAILPEALTIAVTLILVLAMQKMLKRKALVRKLLAVETLGSVSTICIDKTGTLTEGKMRVTKTDFTDHTRALTTLCLCNNLSNPTELALWDFLSEQKNFLSQEIFDSHTRFFEVPFSGQHKFMATANCPPLGDDCALYVKGAPEIVAAMCGLSAGETKKILQKVERWGKDGLRILALAACPISKDSVKKLGIKSIPKLEWLGLVALWDPPRKEVRETLAIASQAGIKIKVITGDYRYTAEKIMSFLGFEIKAGGLIEGHELERLSDKDLKVRVTDAVLFTRVTPEQKLRIVSALQELGEVVAMTGDGVNDAPALKKADIGIVVGEASEVAKETADITLLDSNFKTIVAAVEEGRVVFENIRKTVFYMMADSFSEISLILGSLLLGWPLPLSVLQILWINLICDGPQDILLGLEPKEREIMAEGPKRINDKILNRFHFFLIIVISLLVAGSALLLFWYFGLYLGDLRLGRTMSFMMVVLSSILLVIPVRSFRKPFWRYENFWANPWLLIIMCFNAILQVTIIYLPITQRIFELQALQLTHWIILFSFVAMTILIVEAIKWMRPRKVW